MPLSVRREPEVTSVDHRVPCRVDQAFEGATATHEDVIHYFVRRARLAVNACQAIFINSKTRATLDRSGRGSPCGATGTRGLERRADADHDKQTLRVRAAQCCLEAPLPDWHVGSTPGEDAVEVRDRRSGSRLRGGVIELD